MNNLSSVADKFELVPSAPRRLWGEFKRSKAEFREAEMGPRIPQSSKEVSTDQIHAYRYFSTSPDGDLRHCRPYFWVPLNPNQPSTAGHAYDVALDQILQWLASEEQEPITDIFVISHGWHRNLFSAAAAYDRLVGRFLLLLFSGRLQPKKAFNPLILCVHWHSDPGSDGWFDSCGRRHKASFMANAREYFEAISQPDESPAQVEARFIASFEKIFGVLSEMNSTPEAPSEVAGARSIQEAKALLDGFRLRADCSGAHAGSRTPHSSVRDQDETQSENDGLLRRSLAALSKLKHGLKSVELPSNDEKEVASSALTGREHTIWTANKNVVVWMCYHEATGRGRLMSQTEETPHGYLSQGQAVETTFKFLLGSFGLFALLGVVLRLPWSNWGYSLWQSIDQCFVTLAHWALQEKVRVIQNWWQDTLNASSWYSRWWADSSLGYRPAILQRGAFFFCLPWLAGSKLLNLAPTLLELLFFLPFSYFYLRAYTAWSSYKNREWENHSHPSSQSTAEQDELGQWDEEGTRNSSHIGRSAPKRGIALCFVLAWIYTQVWFTLPFIITCVTTFFFGGMRAQSLWRRSLKAQNDERVGYRGQAPDVNSETNFRDQRHVKMSRSTLAALARWPVHLLRQGLPIDSPLADIADLINNQLAFYMMGERGVLSGMEAGRFIEALLEKDAGSSSESTSSKLSNARLHFIAHSFGNLVIHNAVRYLAYQSQKNEGRLIASLDCGASIQSACSLEAALSSNWFDGEKTVLQTVRGNIANIYSRYDTATGFFFPLSSFARTAAGSIGLSPIFFRAHGGQPDVPIVKPLKVIDGEVQGSNSEILLLVEPPQLVFPAKTQPDLARLINLDASHLIYQGSAASGGAHDDIFKDDVIHLVWSACDL